MEPTDLYNKSKRNLTVFAAILALVLFGGIEATSVSQFFGFTIRPEILPTVLFFVVVYLLYQYFLARVFQSDEIRNRTWIDFIITAGFACIVLVGYFSFYVIYQILGLQLWTAMAVPLVASALMFVYVLVRGSDWIKWRREAIGLREATIEKRVKEPGWLLNFNPKFPDAIKPISFNDDGSVGEGRNSNEHMWRLVGNKLEIINADGLRQNSFLYDPETDQFKSVDRAAKFGIEGQYIFRRAQ